MEDIRLPTSFGKLTLACKLWTMNHSVFDGAKHQPKEELRLIAYPGWLDNSGSFDTCVERLVKLHGFTVLVVDPPGCGWSDHRAESSVYNDFEEAAMIGDLAQEMEWETFGLLGHSRGGGVTAFAAGLLAHRVTAFVAIDSYLALSGLWMDQMINGVKAPEMMRQAWAMNKKNATRTSRVFATFEEAVDANMNNPWFKKTKTTATNIVKRHLRPTKNGFTFTHDTRTYGQKQFLHINEIQCRQFISEIECPILVMLDSERWEAIASPEVIQIMNERVSCAKQKPEYVDMSGMGHHFHSDHPEKFVEIVGPWLMEKMRLGNAEYASLPRERSSTASSVSEWDKRSEKFKHPLKRGGASPVLASKKAPSKL